jgi:RNA 2',3'-cyclic 3'-phosphodiesterase
MRIFTAIPVPKETREKFSAIARGKLPIPYINTDNFHITLNFLGELDTDQVKKVLETWTDGLPQLKRLHIDFEKLTKFRHQIHMTVLMTPELAKLQAQLQQNFSRLGFKPQYSKFYAHMTIGNMHMDNIMNRNRKIADFPNNELAQMSFDAERIVVYESKLLLHHPKYIELAEHKLT